MNEYRIRFLVFAGSGVNVLLAPCVHNLPRKTLPVLLARDETGALMATLDFAHIDKGTNWAAGGFVAKLGSTCTYFSRRGRTHGLLTLLGGSLTGWTVLENIAEGNFAK